MSDYSYRLRLEDGSAVMVADKATANRAYPDATIEAAFEQLPGGSVVGVDLHEALKAERAEERAAKEAAKEREAEAAARAAEREAEAAARAAEREAEAAARAAEREAEAAARAAEREAEANQGRNRGQRTDEKATEPA